MVGVDVRYLWDFTVFDVNEFFIGQADSCTGRFQISANSLFWLVVFWQDSGRSLKPRMELVTVTKQLPRVFHNVIWEEIPRKTGSAYIIHEYLYQRNKMVKDVTYLRCQFYYKFNCKGRAVVTGENGNNKVKIMGSHNHQPILEVWKRWVRFLSAVWKT